jgi:hypothetical protein
MFFLPGLLPVLGAGQLHAQNAPPDPFMGDWQGTLKHADGTQEPICAQVICWGQEGYQANLLQAFDQRVQPLAVLKGKADGDAVALDGGARIAQGAFTGELTGDRAGTYAMKHVARLSPTFDAKPPEGAVVLFDGTNLDEWVGGGPEPFMVDLQQAIGGDNRAAYLRCRITSPKAQPARLELGSDDGVKAWLNGVLVHGNNASRPLTAWQDQADVELEAGENALMLKVINGGGNWGACARIVGRDGKDLPGLTFDPLPALDAGTDLKSFQDDSTGTVVTWEMAGPFMQEGKGGPDLFDVAFPPENDDPAVEWKLVNDRPHAQYRWKLVEDGAMEVTPGSGSLVAKRVFEGDHLIHLEFRTPFMPDARGQGRGNSGVYVQNRWEVQVLDSYGLEGLDNECGGMYHVAQPVVNMCAPPLQWQTYDIDFRAGRKDAAGNVENPRITVRHNGVVIHDDVELTTPNTAGGSTQTGGLLLQDHGNLVRYRNIWVTEG